MIGYIDTPHPDRIYVRYSPAAHHFFKYLFPAIRLRPIARRERRFDTYRDRIKESAWSQQASRNSEEICASDSCHPECGNDVNTRLRDTPIGLKFYVNPVFEHP